MSTRTLTSPTVPRPAAGAQGARSARRLPGRLRLRILVAVLLVLAGGGGGWWWLRDSGLVTVQQVSITGLGGSQAAEIRSALTGAAHEMTTLHVRPELLRAAVARYPVVAQVSASADVPHRLRVRVVEHEAVAAARTDGHSIAVAADGTLLWGVAVDGLPTVVVSAPPAGALLRNQLALAQVRVLAAAPPALRRRVTRMFTGSRGLQAQLRDGPVVAFGAAVRLAAKWAALTAVLADPSSTGAAVIDLSVPESPAATGLEPVGAPSPTTLSAAAGGSVSPALTASPASPSPSLPPEP